LPAFSIRRAPIATGGRKIAHPRQFGQLGNGVTGIDDAGLGNICAPTAGITDPGYSPASTARNEVHFCCCRGHARFRFSVKKFFLIMKNKVQFFSCRF
jgi:hypothetical protein